MRKIGDEKAQMKMSFGMIFSIILIIIFLSVAIYAIMKFLAIQDSMKVGKFVNDLQTDVDRMWKSSQGSQELKYSLPSGIEQICFTDYSNPAIGAEKELYQKLKQIYYEYENLFFYPIGSAEGLEATEIEHIYLEKITENENPYCVKISKGKAKLNIKKNDDEATVIITR